MVKNSLQILASEEKATTTAWKSERIETGETQS